MQQNTRIEFDQIRNLPYDKLMEHYDNLPHNKEDDNIITRSHILYNILNYYITHNYEVYMSGIVEIMNNYGFLRDMTTNFSVTPYDIHINIKIIKEYGLRLGDEVYGSVGASTNNSDAFTLKSIVNINQQIPSKKRRKLFEEFVPIYPDKQIKMEMGPDLTGRIIDLIAPIGFGQRVLVIAPPKGGKTTVMINIAKAVIANHTNENTMLMMLLCGERPEESTYIREAVPQATVLYSTLDEKDPKQHIRVAEFTLQRAKRMSESGKDVVLIVDSLSRLLRAYNSIVPSSGRVLSGGVESASLAEAKSFFGAARNLRNGGSLTIIATCLVDTGSRMDELIFEELKGTGNCDIFLSNKLAEGRIFPAIDVLSSSTRQSQMFLSTFTFQRINLFIQLLHKNMNKSVSNNFQFSTSDNKPSLEQAYKMLVDQLKKTANNTEFLNMLNN